MNVLFVGVACTEEANLKCNQKYYQNKSTVRPQQYFDNSIVYGLSEYGSVTALTEPPVASYPRSKCLFYRQKKELINERLSIKYISLINILGIKSLIIFFTVFFQSIKFCKLNKGRKKAIVLGHLSFYISIPAFIVARVFKIKIFVVVPDIPKYVGGYSNASLLRKCLNFISEKLDKITESNFDGYILLTKYMNALINKKDKPYIIMEGLANVDINSEDNHIIKEKKKILMYAGTLHEKFGIKKLVDAFKLVNVENSELWIYGEGDCFTLIQEECRLHDNIKYKGTKDKKEIQELEKKVTLLINPRSSKEEFTKYSFPSKTIEYMASGTPLLTTKLPGIPQEYYEYVYAFENESVEGMAKDIHRIISLSMEELLNFGGKAKKFIVENKNSAIQTKRIFDFIEVVVD